MMMAHDPGGAPPGRLDEASIDAVRASLRAYLQDSQDPAALQASLLTFASEARSRSIMPEQLLIVLKDIWSGLPEVRSMSDARAQTRLLQRVVTMCIKEYYSV
jgi:hypothetical protein